MPNEKDWFIYPENGRSAEGESAEKYRKMLADPAQCPGWRDFASRYYPTTEEKDKAIIKSGGFRSLDSDRARRADPGSTFVPNKEMVEMANAALYLRRPLLVVGKPGVGKSSLIYSVARELDMGPVLRWGINSRSTRQEGLYQYDAIGRLQAWQLRKMAEEGPLKSEEINQDIGDYLTLGPVGTALLPWDHPRALLIDEIDKGDPDLANDLLDLLEDGTFRIPELVRLKKLKSEISIPTADDDRTEAGEMRREKIVNGVVRCLHFPFVVLTSNGEREFPPAFRRRCLYLEVNEPPDADHLWEIVKSHLTEVERTKVEDILGKFLELRKKGMRTNDQLLNAVFLLTRDFSVCMDDNRKALIEKLCSALN